MSTVEQRILDLMPVLRRYARSLSRNRDDAEDLVQDSLEAALSHLGGWRGANLRGWLLTIMTNMHRNRFRVASTRPRLTQLSDAAMQEPAPSPDLAVQDRLQAAIALLAPEQRSVLMLVVVEGYTYAEAAETLDMPIGTVMSRLSRARRAIAATMDGSNIVEIRKT